MNDITCYQRQTENMDLYLAVIFFSLEMDGGALYISSPIFLYVYSIRALCLEPLRNPEKDENPKNSSNT
jgi:hypothetical protein